MIKTVGIVSLSAGTLGEDFVKHELNIGIKRLNEFGLDVKFMPNALKGIEYVKKHPEKRAEDLLLAFEDNNVDMILCAIGGDDTYRLLPYLFGNGELKRSVREKIFLGFSDSTFNHLMLNKAGLRTFYGQSFLSDVCDIGKEMLPYSEKYFRELISTGTIGKITPSEVWYDAREDYSREAVGTVPASHPDRGFELLQGAPVFSGRILGGCIDSIYDIFNGERYADSVSLCAEYGLFPSEDEWKGKIILLESSEELMPPEKYASAVKELKKAGVFKAVSGVLLGKPMNEIHSDEYKTILKEVINDPGLPIAANINVGHATPRCIVPFGRNAIVDTKKQEIIFTE